MKSRPTGNEPVTDPELSETIGIYSSGSMDKEVVVMESNIVKAKEICISLLCVLKQMEVTTDKTECMDLTMNFSSIRDELNELEL